MSGNNLKPIKNARGSATKGGPGMPMQKPNNFGKSLGKLFVFLKPFYASIIISLIIAVSASVCNIVAPSVLMDLTNEIMVSVLGVSINMQKVAKYGFILIALYLGNAGFNYVQSYIMSGVTQGVSKRFRTSISKKINVLPLSYFDSRSYGDTLSRVTNDVDTIGQTMSNSITTLLQCSVLLVGVLIAMFITKWQMAIVAIATVPISGIIMMVVIKKSQPLFVKQQRYLGVLNGHIEECYSGQNIIKIFNAEERKGAEFKKINEKLFENTWRSQFISGLMMPINTFVSNLGYVAICVVGAILFKDDPVNMGGVIVSFFVYVRLFQAPVNQIGQAFNQLQSTAAAAERVFEFLEEKEQPDEQGKIEKLENVRGEVEFKNVKFGYLPGKTIINNFSAKIAPGMKVAIVGPTGAGKTTIVNLIMRFYDVDEGDILIDGVSVKDVKRTAVRDVFSMVLQDTWLFEGTIRDNIIYSTEGVTQKHLDAVAKAANIDYLIKALPHGYDSVLDESCNVSGGQKQLITIARAMLQNSPMMILDEATSNVDTRTEEQIQEAMDRLTAGRTSFVIAHRLSTIRNADLILVMKDGDIIEQGNHEELMERNGFYSSLYNSQFERIEE